MCYLLHLIQCLLHERHTINPAQSSGNNPSVPIINGTTHHEIQQHTEITGSHVHPNVSPSSSKNLPISHVPHFHFLCPSCSFIALSRKQKEIPLTNRFCVCLKPTRQWISFISLSLYLPQPFLMKTIMVTAFQMTQHGTSWNTSLILWTWRLKVS